jgi:hypothetical protein
MAGHYLRKVTARTPIKNSPILSARWQNAVTDLIIRGKQTAMGQAQQSGNGLNLPTDLIKIRNRTDMNLLRGHVVQLGQYLITKDLKENQRAKFRQLWFEGELPSAPIRRIAIVKKAVKQFDEGPPREGGITSAQGSGVCTAWVNITDTSHTHAVPEADNHILQSASSGSIALMQVLEETGEQEVAVLLGGGGSTIQKVLLTDSVSAASYVDGTLTPASFTARLWISDGSGGFTHSSDDEIECTNPFLTGISVTPDKGRVASVSGGELISVDCTEFTL